MKIGIIIFCLDRPDHLSRLLSSIKPTLVHSIKIVQDKPKKACALKNYLAVQNLCRLFCEENKNANYFERLKNYGLRDNILSGVDSMASKTDFLFVLEDDLFFPNNEFEKSISYIFSCSDKSSKSHYQLINDQYLKDSDVQMSCWGWAINTENWPGSEKLMHTLTSSTLLDYIQFFSKFKLSSPQLFLNTLGIKKTWAIIWAFFVFKENFQISTIPAKVLNTGLDGSGENCKPESLDKKFNLKSTLIENIAWIILSILSWIFRRNIERGWLKPIPPINLPSKRINLPTKRFGSLGDGGYEIPAFILGKKFGLLISLGIHDNAEFEKCFMEYYPDAAGKLYDGVLSRAFLVERFVKNLIKRRFARNRSIIWLFKNRNNKKIKIIPKFVSAKNYSEGNFISWKDCGSEKMSEFLSVLKIDVEGAELQLLPRISSKYHFDIILLELHNLNDLIKDGSIETILPWHDYYIYWMNVNNFVEVQGLVPEVIELGLVKKEIAPIQDSQEIFGTFPSTLNNLKGRRIVEKCF